MTRDGNAKACLLIAATKPFLIFSRPTSSKTCFRNVTLLWLMLRDFGITILLLLQLQNTSLMDLVPAEGNLRGRRKLLLSLGMLEAKPHVSKRKINTIYVHLWNWGWSIMIIYIHTCSFDRWCLFSHYIYIYIYKIEGYYRWWLFQVVMEWPLEDHWHGVCATTRKWVPARHTAMITTSTPILALPEFRITAGVRCLFTGIHLLILDDLSMLPMPHQFLYFPPRIHLIDKYKQ